MSGYKQLVIVDNGDVGGIAIGPVYSDESIDKIRDEAEARGWTLLGQVRLMSFAAFKAEAS